MILNDHISNTTWILISQHFKIAYGNITNTSFEFLVYIGNYITSFYEEVITYPFAGPLLTKFHFAICCLQGPSCNCIMLSIRRNLQYSYRIVQLDRVKTTSMDKVSARVIMFDRLERGHLILPMYIRNRNNGISFYHNMIRFSSFLDYFHHIV